MYYRVTTKLTERVKSGALSVTPIKCLQCVRTSIRFSLRISGSG